jgi:hypothetical protein
MKFDHIIFDSAKTADIEGRYDIQLHNMKLVWDGVEYTYHASGLCRSVYISPCKTFVLKVPYDHMAVSSMMSYEHVIDIWRYMDVTAIHNVLEVIAYEQCPDDLKHWFAHSELLPMGWVKQEYVEVVPIRYAHNMREVGIRPSTGQVCLFDYDYVIDGEMFSPREPHPDLIKFLPYAYERTIKILEKYEEYRK